MNSKAFNKVVLQSLRHSQCRYLSVQQSINKCSGTCHTVNFRDRKESGSSSFIFTKLLNDRTLYQSSLPTYTHFQRNFSGTSQLNGTAKVDPLKDLASVPPPTEEIIHSAEITSASPPVLDNLMVEYGQKLLLEMHNTTGLPWWATIALTAFFVRTIIVLPFAITQIRLTNKSEKVNIEMQDVDKLFKKESIKAQKLYGWPEDIANEKYEEAREEARHSRVVKENCHPMKQYLLISVQLATWSSMLKATYTLCHSDYVDEKVAQQMTTGGFGWITDLTEIDPYLILPLAIGLTSLCITEVHQTFKVLRKTKKEMWKYLFFRILSIATIPFAAYAPAAVNVYWLSSCLYGLVQAFLLNSSPVRRVFRVPINHPELKQPYRYFLKTTKERLRLSKGETALVPK